MATNVQTPVGAAGSVPEAGDSVRYVTRQPILDLHSKVHAYELLFSSGSGRAFRGDREMAARTLLDSTVIFGLEKLTCGLPGFVKCTAEMLAGTLVEMLPAAMTVLEIVDPADASPELMSACRNLKAAGYRLALDQSKWEPQAKPLVGPLAKMADYLKVDFSRTNPRERQTLRGQASDTKATLVAEKVETQEQFKVGSGRGIRAGAGLLFLPAGGAGQPAGARQPAVAIGDSAAAEGRLTEPSQADATCEARCVAYVSFAAADQLAGVRHAATGA